MTASRDPDRLPGSPNVFGRIQAGLVALDPTFRCTYVSPPAASILDASADRLVGQSVWTAFPESARTAVRAAVTTAMQAQAPRRFEHRAPTGRWYGVHVYPGEDGLSLCFTDITARKQREQTMEGLTEEYEALLATAEDSILLIDVDGPQSASEFRFVRFNAAHEAATGLRSDAVRGRTPREVLGADLGAEVTRNYRRCVWARRPISYEESLALPEGTRVWQTHLAHVTLDGQVTRIIGIARDITEQVAREDELRRKNDRLDEFASVVSHDLRNPLHVAKGRTALAQEEGDLQHLETVTSALDRMDAILVDTLMLARQGDTVSAPIRLSMPALVGECWAMVDTGAATLTVVDACVIEGDPGRLLHVFENLFRNAVEHGGEAVAVRVGRSGENAFYVEDDGPGIPSEKQDAVFAPGHSSASGGTGFGLTIVRRIAEAHGWTVAVTEGTDGGARFEFSEVTVGPIEDE